MQSKKKFWQILLAVALAILTTVAFTGCSSSEKKPETGAAAADEDTSLARILQGVGDQIL